MKKEKVVLNFKYWDYTCGDGCCFMYGTELYMNGEKLDNDYIGDDTKEALKKVLEKLGYEVEINDI